jgi:metal-dependent HD superfamily phosphatase/phosphodiesterase
MESDTHSSYHESDASEDMAGDNVVNNVEGVPEATLAAETGVAVVDDADTCFERADIPLKKKGKKIKTLSSVFVEDG